MIERRKHTRYKASLVVKYKRLDDQLAPWHDGPQVKDISLGGMLFSAYEKIPVSTALILKLQIPTGDSNAKMIELQAKVVGVEEGLVSYDTRVSFAELDKMDRAALKEFIDYIS